MIFCCNEPRPASLVTTRAPVRVICQPVKPMRAASTGSGTRSSLATSRCLVVLIGAVSQSRLCAVKSCGAGHNPAKQHSWLFTAAIHDEQRYFAAPDLRLCGFF